MDLASADCLPETEETSVHGHKVLSAESSFAGSSLLLTLLNSITEIRTTGSILGFKCNLLCNCCSVNEFTWDTIIQNFNCTLKAVLQITVMFLLVQDQCCQILTIYRKYVLLFQEMLVSLSQ